MKANSAILLGILLLVVTGVGLIVFSGKRDSRAVHIWGKRGQLPGELARPRAITIIGPHVFVVDFTARIQRYDLDGHFTGVSFTTPDFRNGRPSGLDRTRDGNLIVCDSHYHCVRIYDLDGKQLRHFGGESGTEPGQYGYVSDCVQDQEGHFFVSEFGENDRITKVDAEGKLLKCWGQSGTGPGEFQRIRAMAIGPDHNLYVVDACNHRIQVFTRDGVLLRIIGGYGSEPGQFEYPSDIAFDAGGEMYVVERVNARVQKLTHDGTPLATWGRGGRGPGQLADPWALAVDDQGRVHVVDTENHRIQRVGF